MNFRQVNQEYAPVPGGKGNEWQGQGPANDGGACFNIIRGQAVFSCMLVFVPAGYAAHFLELDPPYVFALNFLAIIPLAWLIGQSKEAVVASVGQPAGGLLHATFGNVVEILLCVAGVRNNEVVLVQCTLLGSILSNLLLVLGTAFLVGGVFYPTQVYSPQGAATQCSLMAITVLAIGLPTIYANVLRQDDEWEHMVEVSRWASIFLFITYCAYLYFRLGTHRSLFEDDSVEDDEQASLSPIIAATVLGITAVTAAFSTNFLIRATRGTVDSWNVSEEFIGIILLPIMANAAVHSAAVTMAVRNNMDLSVALAGGASCRLALLVTPFAVLVGWAYGVEMTLDFHAFQLAVLLLAVVFTTTILGNGMSNWLQGLMMLVTYFIVTLIYFCEGAGKNASLGRAD